MQTKYNYAEKRVSMGNLTRAQADAFEKMPEELKNSFKGNLKNIAKVIGTHDSILSAWLNTKQKETYEYRTTGLYVEFPVLADQASEASEASQSSQASDNKNTSENEEEHSKSEQNATTTVSKSVLSRAIGDGPTGPRGPTGPTGPTGLQVPRVPWVEQVSRVLWAPQVEQVLLVPQAVREQEVYKAPQVEMAPQVQWVQWELQM